MKTKSRIVSVILCALLIAPHTMLSAKEPAPQNPSEIITSSDSYEKYLQTAVSETDFQATVVGSSSTGDASISTEDSTVRIEEDTKALFLVSVPETAFYTIGLICLAADDNVTDPEISITINGEVPFDDVSSLILSRIWQNNREEMKGNEFLADSAGNEISPSLCQKKEFSTITLSDTTGSRVIPYRFILHKGDNTIGITGIRNTLCIASVEIVGYSSDETDYDTYLSQYSCDNYTGDTIILEGEKADRRSSSKLVSQNDKGSPATSPSSPVKTLVNTIGGSSWNKAGQWIEWTVETQYAGWYNIGLRYRQNVMSGMFTTRALTVNGEIPFSDANSLEFGYSADWQAKFFADDHNKPYKIYLRKGENTIRLTASLGRSSEFYAQGRKSVESLNQAYRQIVMLTGTNPDALRNYRIDKNCPQALEIMQEQISVLSSISRGIAEIAGKSGSTNTAIDNLRLQLESFLENPISIPSRIDSFRSNITAYAGAVYGFSDQPLEVDYITLSAPDSAVIPEIDKAQSGFFEKFTYEIKAFVSSFTADYSAISGTAVAAGKTISVWTAMGRDQATILKRLTDMKFTPKSGIAVDLKMVSNGTGVSTLLLATVSGFGPDVAIGLSNSDAVNYALRDTAVDLCKFDDFAQISERFSESAMIPFDYNGGCYALPLTQGFSMMFWRTDILSELEISPPDTWQRLYSVIGQLQKKNMTVGIPSDLTYLVTMIAQNGGTIYSEDNSKSLFDSNVSMTAFSKWSDLYTSYNLPIDYDGANRFRTGEMPLIIADYSFYNTISVLAPEINGLWQFGMIPGTDKSDGSVNHTAAATGTCAMILSTAKNRENAWSFLSWLTEDETQSGYARSIESRLGIAARYQTANTAVMKDIAWTRSEYEALNLQWQNTIGIPEIPGGYYVARNINNALRNVVSYRNDPQEILKEYTISINDEIRNKRDQYNLD